MDATAPPVSRPETGQEALLPRIAAGDSAAVTECVDRYSGLVWSLARRSIRDHSQAEDAVQEIFISIWKAAARYDPARGSESLFITTIARRRLIDLFRGNSRRREVESLEDVEVPQEGAFTERIERDEEIALALAGIERLKPDQRRLLELWFVRGMTHTEIATSTGVPLGTVKSQIRRGLLRVRELVEGRRLTSEATA